MLKQQFLVFLIFQLTCHKGGGIVVVGELYCLGNRSLSLVLVPGRHIKGVFLCNPALTQIFIQKLTPTTPGNSRILQHQPIGTVQVEATNPAQP